MFAMEHTNFTVFDLEKSMAFYQKALGLTEQKRINSEDGSFTIVFMGNAGAPNLLELTCYHEKKEPWNLGDNEIHVAFRADDFTKAYELHKEMDCICYENKDMGIYFIADPDGYWLEILPKK